ncbi:MAG TPA: hypothetical protein VFO16_08560 [Pseudonocardiaceae bacterium]|nr:hypothetical protein [Pseudonocardiaceae bacterium]
MMTPVEVERKVRQLDNDVQAIYVMLADIAATQTRHGNRMAEIDSKLVEMDAKVTELDSKVTGLDTKVTGLDTKVTALDTKLDAILGLLNGARPADSR